ncbi:MAG: hypothetical protein WAZ94_03915 [Phycisphaerales bacterium]
MPVACTQLRSLPRDRDNYTGGTPNPMTSASDGTLEERRYYCQNWRADVVAVTKSDGTPLEYVRYSAYGEPTVYPVADLNMDGVVNSTDSGLWSDLIYSASNSSVYADTDLDWDGADDQASSGVDRQAWHDSPFLTCHWRRRALAASPVLRLNRRHDSRRTPASAAGVGRRCTTPPSRRATAPPSSARAVPDIRSPRAADTRRQLSDHALPP